MSVNFPRWFLNWACIGLLIFAVSFTVAAPAVADEQGDAAAQVVVGDSAGDAAKAVVDSLHNQLFAAASDPTFTFAERFEQLAPVVEASYDFKYISRFILRRSWRDLEPAQQEKFISAFQRLSVANYASRFAELKEESLVITEVAAGSGERVQVDARLQSEEIDVLLSYTLAGDEGENWAIVNLIADGVSDLALRRAEYSRVLKEKGFDGLLTHIDKQVDSLQ